MTPDGTISEIKTATFSRLKNARQVWIIEETGEGFTVHRWTGSSYKFGAGVGPPHDYPTLRKAAARLLQLFGTGPVAPQTWPEEVCLGEIILNEGGGQ